MPPKRVMESEEDTEELSTSCETGSEDSSVEETQHQSGSKTEKISMLLNNPNDEKHPVEDTWPLDTPSKGSDPSPRSREGGSVTFSPTTADVKSTVQQRANVSSSRQQSMQSSSGSPTQFEKGSRVLRNNPNDEVVPVEDAHNVATPRAKQGGTRDKPKPISLRNAPHDEAFPVSTANSTINTPKMTRGGRPSSMNLPEGDTENNTDSESNDQDRHTRGYSNQRPEAIDTGIDVSATVVPNLEYKPQNYEKVNMGATREMQELFKHILDYQPVVPELPAKLRSFIPDYVPSVGDLDPFCKVPRPDGRPDGLGIYILDEPSVPQSNPAVVLLELRATNIHSTGGLVEVVDSFEDAANRPEVINRWIADVRKVHYKKPLPTINYQKPMPEIETLLQVWPSEFEEFLNSDIQFPPPGIDLDLDQYVRTLCCILDIPTYNSLIDSLHVMFTLYQEFRANQHFQHE